MIKMLAQKTGDSFFEIDFSRKCYAANRSSVTLYKICGESGYIDAGVIPSFSLCSDGSDWFKARSQWQERDYEPCAGDIIFFDWGV